jgi:hypothetical protein
MSEKERVAVLDNLVTAVIASRLKNCLVTATLYNNKIKLVY